MQTTMTTGVGVKIADNRGMSVPHTQTKQKKMYSQTIEIGALRIPTVRLMGMAGSFQ